MALVIFPTADAVLKQVDLQVGHLDEWRLITDLQNAIGDPANFTDTERLSAWATVEAFRFQRPNSDNRWPWQIYWCALASGTTQDGHELFSPDIGHVDNNVLQLWAAHAVNAKHPAIRARFADLVWDIGQWSGRKPDSTGTAEYWKPSVKKLIELAQIAIDSYLNLIESDWAGDEYAGWQLLSRSLELSSQINDAARKATAKQALFAYLEKLSNGGAGFQWWRFDEIAWAHRKQFTDDEKAAAISLLERTISEKSDFTDPLRFNPHDAKNAAESLGRWVPQNERERTQSYVRTSGAAFENAAESSEALVAMAWLEDLIPFYRNAGLFDDAARVERSISSRAAQAESEFGQFEVTVDMPKERVEKWIEDTAGESLKGGLRKIAARCLIREQSTRDSIVNMTRNAPLYAMMSSSVMGNDGFTTAIVGSISDDLPGRAMLHAADLFNWNASWLNAALNRLREKHAVTTEALTASFEGHQLFVGQQMSLVTEGLSAWFAGDWVKATHVLVPQVEAILRNMLSLMGRSVRQYDLNVRGFKNIGLGRLLDDEAMKTDGLRDVRFHFMALYADPRAINLRNHLAHGMVSHEFLSIGVANWVVHSLLVLRSIGLVPQDAATDSTP